MASSHLILCHPLFLLPLIPPSIRVFSNESSLRMRWPKYWSFSFSISPSKEHPGLISFRMDWLDLLAVQGTLKSLLQHHGFISMQFYNFLCCGHAYSLFDLFLGPWYSLILLYMVSFSLFMFPRYLRASLIVQTVKNQPAMRET